MAATLTDELTRVPVADIEKWEDGPDGTLFVYGRCTTPEIDTDEQSVDSGWSGVALKEYLATAPTVRVQHNAQRDPAGSGVRVDVNRDGDGAHWLKAAVDEPIAQRLVRKGHLRAFSVGISRPVIERDMSGKARGGIIKGGKIVEVSLVDSPANRSCFLELSKADKNGDCEFTGKLAADEDFLRKALGDDLLTKDNNGSHVEKAIAPAEPAGIDTWSPPADLNISFTPDDMMRLMQQKFVDKHYDELAVKAVMEAEAPVYKRDIDTATRRRLAADGKALPNLSYPIENSGDLQDAAHLARTGHGDVAAARRLIARRARELGVANPLDESDEVKKTISEEEVRAEEAHLAAAMKRIAEIDAAEAAEKEAEPDVTKDPEPEEKPKPVKKAKKPKKGPKKLPPWLNKPADSDDDGDSDDGDDKAEKCHVDPAQAAGVPASPMDPAPVGDLMETPAPASCKGGPTPASASGASEAAPMQAVPAHREPDGAAAEAFEKDAKLSDGDNEKPTRLEGTMKAAPELSANPELAALVRFKTIGIDPGLGRLHDLTCPAFHPETVVKYHPFADFASAVDLDAFQKMAVRAAAGGDLEHAKAMQMVWQAAGVLKAADPGVVNDFRLEAHKAFRDANPGPASAPTPGSISPQRYNRGCITEGHAAESPGYGPPNTSPQMATSAPNAHSFDRPPLASGHQSPSPSHMKGGMEYPAQQGVPVRLNYALMEKERARQALVQMHEHLSRQFPEACPISLDGPQQPESRPIPVPAGISKAIDPAPAELPEGITRWRDTKHAPDAAFKATPEGDADMFADADVFKAFKKMRKKLGKRVLSGKMTVDEARAKLGRQFTQKGTEKPSTDDLVKAVAQGIMSIDEARAKLDLPAWNLPETQKSAEPVAIKAAAAPLAAAVDPEVIKSAITEATADLRDLLLKQQETFTAKLAEQQKVIDAIADQPDPSTAAFSGLAFNPLQKSRRPAGVVDQAEHAARVQSMTERSLQELYNSSSDPYAREGYYTALNKLRGGAS